MNKYVRASLQVILILGVAAFCIWFINLLVPKPSTQEVTQQVVTQVQSIILKRPTCAGTSDEFNKLKSQGNYVTLVKGLNGTYGIAGDGFVNDKEVRVNRTGTGSEIACGYLYIDAGVGNRPLNEKYENTYIASGDFGGHLENSAAIVDKTVASSTELLFSLENIQYRKGKTTTDVYTADFASLLNVSNYLDFDIALNTLNPMGYINEVGIAYKCWNPQTGAVTNDCSLQVAE